MVYRFIATETGATHMTIDVFVAPMHAGTFANTGRLMMSPKEWKTFRTLLMKGPHDFSLPHDQSLDVEAHDDDE